MKDLLSIVSHFQLQGTVQETYWHDGESYWRVMAFIPNARTYETVNPNIRIMQA